MAAAAATPFTFKKPVQTRATDASGVVRPVYSFAVEKADALSGTYDCEGRTAPLQFLTNTLFVENPTWLPQFVDAFLQSTKPYFVKPYAPAVVLKHMTHRVVADGLAEEEGTVTRIYTPTAVVIAQGRFTLDWKVSQELIAIQIPVEDEEDLEEEVMLTATQQRLLGLGGPTATNEVVQQVDTAALPFSGGGVTEVLDLRTDEQQAFYKRKVKEAHLRAKLAQYKAERALAKYMDKYGDTLSDTSGESGWETSDAESSGSDSD